MPTLRKSDLADRVTYENVADQRVAIATIAMNRVDVDQMGGYEWTTIGTIHPAEQTARCDATQANRKPIYRVTVE